MFGLFQLFGPSKVRRRLDAALRDFGLHPRLVPDAVKIAIIRMLEQQDGPDGATESACAASATLLAYLIHGRGVFVEDNGVELANSTEDRIATAIAFSDGLDAQQVLLALHAGLVADEVIDAFELEIG